MPDGTIHGVDSWSEALLCWPATVEQLAASGYEDTREMDVCECGETLFIFTDAAAGRYAMTVANEDDPARYHLHSPAMCHFNAQVKIEGHGQRRAGRLF